MTRQAEGRARHHRDIGGFHQPGTEVAVGLQNAALRRAPADHPVAFGEGIEGAFGGAAGEAGDGIQGGDNQIAAQAEGLGAVGEDPPALP